MTAMPTWRRVVLLGCLAPALAVMQAGCAEQVTGSAAFTCGHMRDTVGAFRDQGRLIVDRAGSKSSALSIEEAVQEVELLLRDACRHAGADFQPYDRVSRAPPSE